MWCGFTWFMLVQLCVGALSASNLRSSNTHQQVRSGGKRQRSLEQVDSDLASDSALGVTQLMAESVSNHPKKHQPVELSAPAGAKTQKATSATSAASKKAAISKSKKTTASKEVATELEETVAEAQDTLASAETEETDAAEKTKVVKRAKQTHKTQKSQETEESEESQMTEEKEEVDDAETGESQESQGTEETGESQKSEEKEDVDDAETQESDESQKTQETEESEENQENEAEAVMAEEDESDEDMDQNEKNGKAGAETDEEATQASDNADKETEVSGTEEAKESNTDGDIEKASVRQASKTDKNGKETHKASTEHAKNNRKITRTEDSSLSTKNSDQTEIMENTEAPSTNMKPEVSHAEEHEGLPKLKGWAMVGRLFRRLHASVIAFQGGSPEEVTLIAQAPDDDGPSTANVFSSLLLWSCLSCLVAYFYSNRKEKPGSGDAEKLNEGVEVFQEWKHGLFSCYEDAEVTLCALCCPSIRWAMTLSYVPGLLSFWVAFFIYVCVEILGGLTGGTIGWICLALLCTAYRQELRQKFNMEQQGGMTYITDAMTYLCCTCCAIAQEARQVEDALKSGHPALQESEEKSEAGQ